MKRHLLNVLTWMSLLLFIATMALWVRSRFASDEIILEPWINSLHREYDIASRLDGLAIEADISWDTPGLHWDTWKPSSSLMMPSHPPFSFLGIKFVKGVRRFAYGPDLTVGCVILPFWLVAITTAITPVMWMRGYRSQKLIKERANEQLCKICGYDLRATPNRCPECGTTTT